MCNGQVLTRLDPSLSGHQVIPSLCSNLLVFFFLIFSSNQTNPSFGLGSTMPQGNLLDRSGFETMNQSIKKPIVNNQWNDGMLLKPPKPNVAFKICIQIYLIYINYKKKFISTFKSIIKLM